MPLGSLPLESGDTLWEDRLAGTETKRRSYGSLLMALVPVTVIGVLVFWWLGTLPDHAHPEVGREIFGNIPGPIVALFYVTIAVFLGLTVFLFAMRADNWERGAGEDRSRLFKQRILQLRKGLSMKTLLEDPAAGIPHAALYYGFLVLFLGTVTVELDHLLPNNLKFLEGGFYQGYSAVMDGAAVVMIAGVVWAAVRRWGSRPWRLRGKTKAEDVWILLVLGLIAITGLATEAARIAHDGRPISRSGRSPGTTCPIWCRTRSRRAPIR